MTQVTLVSKPKVEEDEMFSGVAYEQLSSEKQAIVDRIRQLEEELKNIKGTECEVYSRVVGYFRPVKQWNEGKQAEYKDRVVFDTKKAEIPNGRPKATTEPTEGNSIK
jgi:hypothetical protein